MFEPQRPGFPWTSYGPLNPETTEDLELPDNEAEGKGHRYLLCAPCLPGFLTEKKKWGKHEATPSISQAMQVIAS